MHQAGTEGQTVKGRLPRKYLNRYIVHPGEIPEIIPVREKAAARFIIVQ